MTNPSLQLTSWKRVRILKIHTSSAGRASLASCGTRSIAIDSKDLPPEIDPKDPIQILRIAPQWLLVRATNEAQVNLRVAGAFERHGIERLGDLLRFDRAAMLEWRNFGRTSLAKLADWLFVEAGRLPPDAQTEEHVATEGASLRGCLENSISALPSNPASILRGRLGANGTVRKLAEIGAELDLSRERVRQIEQRYTRKIIASYYWDDLLTEKIADRIASAGSPVYVDLLGAEDTWFRGFEGLEIYLSRVIEAFTEGDFFAFDLDGRLIVSRVRKSAWKSAERDASAYLGERHSPALSRRQVELALESIAVQAGAGELRATCSATWKVACTSHWTRSGAKRSSWDSGGAWNTRSGRCSPKPPNRSTTAKSQSEFKLGSMTLSMRDESTTRYGM